MPREKLVDLKHCILILDESFAALDIGTRMKIYALMDQLAHREHGTRLVMVTHPLEDISEIFTHVMIMKDENIFKQGRRAKILDKPVLAEAFGLF